MANTFTDHLRALSDGALAALFGRRPDLLTPQPTDISALAARAQSRVFVVCALDGLDLFTLEILDACRLARDASIVGDPSAGTRQTGNHQTGDVLTGNLQTRNPQTGRHPAGLGRPAANLDPAAGALASDPAALRRTLLAVGPAGRAVLDRLAAGPPIGTASQETIKDVDTTVGALVDRHLLVAVADDTVELPREVAVALRRDGVLGPLHPHAPSAPGASRS